VRSSYSRTVPVRTTETAARTADEHGSPRHESRFRNSSPLPTPRAHPGTMRVCCRFRLSSTTPTPQRLCLVMQHSSSGRRLDYRARCDRLRCAGVACGLASVCRPPGKLDASIVAGSETVNDSRRSLRPSGVAQSVQRSEAERLSNAGRPRLSPEPTSDSSPCPLPARQCGLSSTRRSPRGTCCSRR